MSSPNSAYASRSNLTPAEARDVRDVPEAHLSALVRVYALARKRYQEEKMTAEPAPEPDGRDDAKESDDGCAATPNHTKWP